MKAKHRPQRSCVICRAKQDKRELTRLVFADGNLRIDGTGKLNGRGAYLCGKTECWAQAAEHPLMSKALRRAINDEDREYLRQMTPQ